MPLYTCPTCGAKMERDLLLFTKHTDQHIVEELKRLKPNWVTEDGFCGKCLDYYKKAMHDPDGVETINMGPGEIRKRMILGSAGLIAGALMLYGLKAAQAPQSWRFLVFLPFFAGALGFLQAKKKVCVVFARKGVRNMDRGEEKIAPPSQLDSLRRSSSQIWTFSIIISVVLTAVCVIFLGG